MDEALRIIISKSADAATEAIQCIRAIQVKSPMVQQRYNRTVEIAFADPKASFAPEERSLIAEYLGGIEADSRGYMLRIRLTENERAELERMADEAQMSMSEYVRDQIFRFPSTTT